MRARHPGRTRFPRLTATVFAVLGVIGAVMTAYFRGRAPHRFKITTGAAAVLAAISFVGVWLLADHPGVQRVEQRLERWLRPPRRLRLTREGRYFIGITLGIGFAAINTGNNLLYLLLGMLLSLILASGVLSEMSLRGLSVERLPPARVQAERPFLMGIALRNGKRRLPSFSIEVEDLLDDQPLERRCWFLKVPAGREQRTSYRHAFARRGRHQLTGVRLSTRFPFGLFRKWRVLELPMELVVLPQVDPVQAVLPARRGAAGDETRQRRSRRGEFYGLRDLREGDDLREVHWRSTARRGRPMVREHEEEAARRVTIFVDNGLPGGEACTDEALREALERTVRQAASLSAHYVGREYAVRLVARGDLVPSGAGPTHLDRLLYALALLPAAEADAPWAGGPERNADSVYVVRQGGPAPPVPTGTPGARVVAA